MGGCDSLKFGRVIIRNSLGMSSLTGDPGIQLA